MTKIVQIPLSKLVRSTANVRTTDIKDGIAELAANIERNNFRLLQNIVVTPGPGGKYGVVAGARRFAALKLLQKKKKIPADHGVDVLIIDEAEAAEASLAENVLRKPMHPADEFAAFTALIENGASIEDVAARFGVTPGVVTRRMKLAAVSPVILRAFREDRLNLEHVMGFTVTDDHAAQEKVFAHYENRLPYIDRYQIIRLLTEDHLETKNPVFRFVGKDAYLAAGGQISYDLFGDADDGYADNAALVYQLADAKLAPIAADYQAKGWKWIIPDLAYTYATPRGFDRIMQQAMPISDEHKQRREKLQADRNVLRDQDDLTDEESDRLDQIEQEIADINDLYRAYRTEEMALAGGWLTINHNGQIQEHLGYVRKEDRKALKLLAGDTDAAESDDSAIVDEPEPLGPKLSDTLLADLHIARTQAMRDELVQQTSLALRVLAHGLACRLFLYGPMSSILTMNPTYTYLNKQHQTEGAQAQRREAWEIRLANAEDAWTIILGLPDEDILDLLAVATASMVDATYSRGGTRHGENATRVADAVNLDMGQHWTPTVETYLGRVGKGVIIEAVTEAKGGDAAAPLAKMTKAEMAIAAESLLAGTGWVPQPFRRA